MYFLCCDLGGTSGDWAVYNVDENDFIFRSSIQNREFQNFYDMMDHFLSSFRKYVGEQGYEIISSAIAVAGRVDNSIVFPTNIEGWEVGISTTRSILEDHGHKPNVSIINDFEALGYGLLKVQEQGFASSDFENVYGRLRTGPPRMGESLATRSLVCGPGTGLGIACMIEGLKHAGHPYIISSEMGHCSLAPETVQQHRLLSSNGVFDGKISFERAVSHSGMQYLYNFFRRSDYNADPNYSIKSSEIVDLAISGRDQAATDSIELFCQILASFCGNAALAFNCDKAVYLWGGMIRKMPLDLLKGRFKRFFADRAMHSERIARVPVVVMRNEDIPLLGCVHRACFDVEDDGG